jgi:hypothetical protein
LSRIHFNPYPKEKDNIMTTYLHSSLASARRGFVKGGSTYLCNCCGKRTRSTGRGDNEHAKLCAKCFDIAGLENEHSDGFHRDQPNPECPDCKGIQAAQEVVADLTAEMAAKAEDKTAQAVMVNAVLLHDAIGQADEALAKTLNTLAWITRNIEDRRRGVKTATTCEQVAGLLNWALNDLSSNLMQNLHLDLVARAQAYAAVNGEQVKRNK